MRWGNFEDFQVNGMRFEMTNDQEPMTKQIQNTNDQSLKRSGARVLVIQTLRIGACLVFGSWSLVLAGCGGGDAGRYTVTGKVTFQGKPVDQGEITFENPTAGQVNS